MKNGVQGEPKGTPKSRQSSDVFAPPPQGPPNDGKWTQNYLKTEPKWIKYEPKIQWKNSENSSRNMCVFWEFLPGMSPNGTKNEWNINENPSRKLCFVESSYQASKRFFNDFTRFFITLVRHVADPGPPNDAKNEAKIRWKNWRFKYFFCVFWEFCQVWVQMEPKTKRRVVDWPWPAFSNPFRKNPIRDVPCHG